MVKAQQWLTDNYENKKNETTEIRNNENIKLDGGLTIDNYSNLTKIFLGGSKGITELIINNCPNVEVIFVSDNQIIKIEGLPNLTKLRKLSFGNNKVEEVDVSQNKQLEMLTFFKNPSNLKFTNGIKGLTNLTFWNSDETFAITKFLEQASEEDLKGIAEELKLNVEGKTPSEMKQIIKNEAAKIEQNKTKINEKLPGLLDQAARVDDNKLAEIKDKVDKGEEYQKLVNELANAPIVDIDKIDQTKLTDELKKTADYKKLATDNSDLVTDDGKISQEKINGLKTASGDAKDAMSILGVDNLKPETLNAKLGGVKLSDIPGSETLKSTLEKNKKLEEALSKVGINPNDVDIEKRLVKWSLLEKAVIEIHGKNYEKSLEVQEYQNQIEVNTNK